MRIRSSNGQSDLIKEDEVVSFDDWTEALRIQTKHGEFRIKETREGHLEINFSALGAKYLLAVLPKSGNVVELQPSEH